jgi:hypothetical protein
MILFIRLRSMITALSTTSAVSPRPCGGPELTGTRGVRLSLAHFTIASTSPAFFGLTTHPGVFRGIDGDVSAYSASTSVAVKIFSLPTIFSSVVSTIAVSF